MILMAFTDPIVYLVDIPAIVKKIKICMEKNKGDECKMTQ
jgi:hypothetical protein